MIEGEFKQRIRQWWAEGYVEDLSIEEKLVGTNDAPFEILDEARKDIFSAIHVEIGIDTRRRDIDAIKLFAALDKWFGDGKK